MENFIQINGKEYPIKFSYAALMGLEQKLKKTFVEISFELSKGSVTTMMEIALMGLQKGAKSEGAKFKMKILELADVITEKELVKAIEIFSDSFAPEEEKTDEENDTDEEKKTE